jgi:phosphoenolpyruvate carboxykinase (ATP)
MSVPGIFIPAKSLIQFGLKFSDSINYQSHPDALIEDTIRYGEGMLSNTGALVINTGKFTGRTPKDKFIVLDENTAPSIHWNEFNIPVDEIYYDIIHNKLLDYLNTRTEIWIRDSYACTDDQYRINIRVVNEKPWSDLFAYNMFLRPEEEELKNFKPEWTIITAPGLHLNPAECGTRQPNAAILSFKHKTILIAGTGYTGEIKKAVFTILNYLLPKRGVLSMHCSANIGSKGDTAIFFGLSGTGKTTLSASPERKLIGDDEHGWSDHSIFNFEGGCYAKTIDLREEWEPEIFHAIRHGALVENVKFFPGTNTINFSDRSITENTRVSYPIDFINNHITPSIGNVPENIFFLTCDAYGILPPISRLSPGQAMYQFISGYTAKIAGTETGITEPKTTFSACFGAPFLPLHPGVYAEILGNKIKEHNISIWLVNTGWTGGCYGTGSRIQLKYTRAMINAALDGKFNDVEYESHPVFGMAVPKSCPSVPSEILNPRNCWTDQTAYDKTAIKLARLFIENFDEYKSGVSGEILNAGPKVY